MKIALITDTHHLPRGGSPIIAHHMEVFYRETFFPYLVKNNIKTIIHLGDIMDNRKSITYFAASRFQQDFVEPLERHDIKMHVIIGNHDIVNKNTLALNCMEVLYPEHPNIHIHSKPEEFTFDKTKILMMPWICDDNEKAAFNLVEKTKAKVLFGHLELMGFEMYRGYAMTHGHPSEFLHKFDLVCSGHYHHKSVRGNINYLGSPYQMTWSDYDDPRGFHIFDTDTLKLEYIQNHNEFFHKIFYDDSETTEQYSNADLSEYGQCYLKVVVKKKTNQHCFDDFIKKLEKIGAADIQIVEEKLDISLTMESETIDESEDALSIIKKCVDEIPNKEYNIQLFNLMKELYEEAMNSGVIV